MTQEETQFYNNLKDNPSINNYIFNQLFTIINDTTIAKPNVKLQLIGGIPMVYNTFTDNNVFDNLFPSGLSNQNSIEKNATQYALNSPFSENSIFHPNFDIKRNEEEEEKRLSEINKDINLAYETDGHYSTVYLVCLMLGVSDENALELAIATENPDTDVHSETDFELDDTWSDTEYQESIHALTGGFHGVEEFFTAIKILYTPNSNIKKIGELLHRFGDCYAHSKIDNIVPNDLDTYNLNENPENEKKAIESWKGKKGENLGNKITPWITFFNYYMKKYPNFLTNKNIQKKALHGKDLKESLIDIYLLKPTDKYIMYGGEKIPLIGGTADHFSSDKGYPDFIYMRPDWYLTYVENLSWILATKYHKNLESFEIDNFKKMVKFATENKCTMKGIIDYEIAKKRNKIEVTIPVFYSNPDRFFASIDAVKNSDYYKIATEIVDNTKKYIIQDGKKVVLVDKVKGNIKVNFSTGFFDTLAFKIKFK